MITLVLTETASAFDLKLQYGGPAHAPAQENIAAWAAHQQGSCLAAFYMFPTRFWTSKGTHASDTHLPFADVLAAVRLLRRGELILPADHERVTLEYEIVQRFPALRVNVRIHAPHPQHHHISAYPQI